MNNSLNSTNANLTYNFSANDILNITANLTDWMDRTQISWFVTIQIIVSPSNISDILIIPKVTITNNILIIKANITSINQNLSNVSAYLNLKGDHNFLAETPQNQTIGALWTLNSTQIRWYVSMPSIKTVTNANITYATKTENYQGENEKVVITEPINEMEILIGIVIIGIAFLFLIVSFSLSNSKHPALKLLFVYLSLIVVPIGINYVYLTSVDQNSSAAVQDLLANLYKLTVYMVVLFSVYIIIYYIYIIFNHFSKNYKA